MSQQLTHTSYDYLINFNSIKKDIIIDLLIILSYNYKKNPLKNYKKKKIIKI